MTQKQNAHGGPNRNQGRRHLDGKPHGKGEYVKPVCITLPQAMIDWLDNEPGTRSQIIRNLIKAQKGERVE